MCDPACPADPGDMLRNLVIPLDGSEFARVRCPWVSRLAWAANATIRVIGIAPTDAELALTYDPSTTRLTAGSISTMSSASIPSRSRSS